MKALITGASGYVGSYLTKNEKRLTFRKVVRGKKSSSSDPNFFEVQKIDGQTDWTGAFDGVEAVIHLAALNNNAVDGDFNEVNVRGTLRLAQAAAAAGVKRFLFLSTSHVHGSSAFGVPFDESMPLFPHGDYAVSKAAAEAELMKVSAETAMEVVILRPTMVYGAKSKNNFGKLVQLVRRLPILPFGLADQKRSFISLGNLSDLIYVGLTHPKAAGEIFLAADAAVSIKEFTNAIAQGLTKEVRQLPIPIWLFKLLGQFTGRAAQVEQIFGEFRVDAGKTEKLLGWKPKETLKQTMRGL